MNEWWHQYRIVFVLPVSLSAFNYIAHGATLSAFRHQNVFLVFLSSKARGLVGNGEDTQMKDGDFDKGSMPILSGDSWLTMWYIRVSWSLPLSSLWFLVGWEVDSEDREVEKVSGINHTNAIKCIYEKLRIAKFKVLCRYLCVCVSLVSMDWRCFQGSRLAEWFKVTNVLAIDKRHQHEIWFRAHGIPICTLLWCALFLEEHPIFGCIYITLWSSCLLVVARLYGRHILATPLHCRCSISMLHTARRQDYISAFLSCYSRRQTMDEAGPAGGGDRCLGLEEDEFEGRWYSRGRTFWVISRLENNEL